MIPINIWFVDGYWLITGHKTRTNISWNDTLFSDWRPEGCDWMTGVNLLTKSLYGSSCDLFSASPADMTAVPVRYRTAAGQQTHRLIWTQQFGLHFDRSTTAWWREVKNKLNKPTQRPLYGRTHTYVFFEFVYECWRSYLSLVVHTFGQKKTVLWRHD